MRPTAGSEGDSRRESVSFIQIILPNIRPSGNFGCGLLLLTSACLYTMFSKDERYHEQKETGEVHETCASLPSILGALSSSITARSGFPLM